MWYGSVYKYCNTRHESGFAREPELNIYWAFFSGLPTCCHFYIFGTRKLHSRCLWVKARLDVGPPPLTAVLATPLSSNSVVALPIKENYLAKHKLVREIYVSLTLNSNLSRLVIPGFSLVGRMIDSRLIGAPRISLPSSQILGGFNQLLPRGIKTRCSGLTPLQVVL